MSERRISEPKGFQLATVQAALATLTGEEGPRRFLVADEVGLGKTVVARTIIQEMIKRRRRPLIVFYVSSNLNIAHQNRAKLLELLPTEAEQKAATAAADRLTLAANSRYRPTHEKLHLYTLTPDTSVPPVSPARRVWSHRRARAYPAVAKGEVSIARHALVLGKMSR